MTTTSLSFDIPCIVNGISSTNTSIKNIQSYKYRIRMYGGITLPLGYVWCDGNNGTPDLRDKFIYSTHPGYTNMNSTNVPNVSVNLSDLSYPKHTHTANYTHSYNNTLVPFKRGRVRPGDIATYWGSNANSNIGNRKEGNANLFGTDYLNLINQNEHGYSTVSNVNTSNLMMHKNHIHQTNVNSNNYNSANDNTIENVIVNRDSLTNTEISDMSNYNNLHYMNSLNINNSAANMNEVHNSTNTFEPPAVIIGYIMYDPTN